MLEGGQVGCDGPASMAKHGGSKQDVLYSMHAHM